MPIDPNATKAEIPLTDLKRVMVALTSIRQLYEDDAVSESVPSAQDAADEISRLLEDLRKYNNEAVTLNGGDPNYMIDEPFSQ